MSTSRRKPSSTKVSPTSGIVDTSWEEEFDDNVRAVRCMPPDSDDESDSDEFGYKIMHGPIWKREPITIPDWDGIKVFIKRVVEEERNEAYKQGYKDGFNEAH